MILLSASIALHADTTSFALKIDGQGVYRKTLFLGIGVDVKKKSAEGDRFAGAVMEMQEALRRNCSQESGGPSLLLEERADSASVVKALKALADPVTTKPNDRVIVDLVCHGDTQGQFLLSGGSKLPMPEVRRLFLQIPARHKLLLIDGCYAGSILGQAAKPFDGASWQEAKSKDCSVVWASSQKDQTSESELGGTVFHKALLKKLSDATTIGKTTTLSEIAGGGLGVIRCLTQSNSDLVLAGPDSKEPPPLLPNQPRQEPEAKDAEAAMALRKQLKEEEKSLVTLAQAEKLRQSIHALTLYKTKDMAGELSDALKDGERALVVYNLADHKMEYAAINSDLGYCCAAVGEWKPDKALLAAGIQRLRLAVNAFDRRSDSASWSDVQVMTGNALATLGELDDLKAARDAAATFREVLNVITKESNPRKWAIVENDLGTVLELLGELGDREALKDSLVAFRRALEIRTLGSDPAGWTESQNNLACALLTCGEMGDSKALEESIRAFRSVLDVRSRKSEPMFWAQTQSNLGIALLRLGERGDHQALKDAISTFRLAQEVLTRKDYPAYWARTEDNLANALSALGHKFEPNASKEAVVAYRLALEVNTIEVSPQGWATSQYNLGVVLIELTDRGDESALADATAALNCALNVWTQNANPSRWALVQNKIGSALRRRGERGDTKAFDDSVAAYRNALLVFSFEDDPASYGDSHMGLAQTLESQKKLPEAAREFREAARGYKKAGFDEWVDSCEKDAKRLGG